MTGAAQQAYGVRDLPPVGALPAVPSAPLAPPRAPVDAGTATSVGRPPTTAGVPAPGTGPADGGQTLPATGADLGLALAAAVVAAAAGLALRRAGRTGGRR